MNPLTRTRRDAEDFDDWLASLDDGSTSDVESTSFAPLAATVAALRTEIPVEPRRDFAADLRAQLMVAAPTSLAAAPEAVTVQAPPARTTAAATAAPSVRRRTRRERRFAVAITAMAVVGVTGTVAVAAQSALPGEALYPVKRAIEDARAGLQPDAADKGESLLARASGRLDEVDQLREDGSDDVVSMISTIEDFTAQAQEASQVVLGAYESGGGEQPIADLRAFTSESLDALKRIGPSLPDAAQPSLVEAARAIDDIDLLARQLCPGCTDLPVLAMSSFSGTVIPQAWVSDPQDAGTQGRAVPGADRGRAKSGAVGNGTGTGTGDGSTGRGGGAGDTAGAADTAPGTTSGGAATDPAVPGSDDPVGEVGGTTSTTPPRTGLGGVVNGTIGGVKGALDGLGKGKNQLPKSTSGRGGLGGLGGRGTTSGNGLDAGDILGGLGLGG